MNEVKNLWYEIWLIYKRPRQDLGFAVFYSKCFTQIYRALYGDAMLVPNQMAAVKWQKIPHGILLLKRKVVTLELRNIEIYTFSSARTVQLAET